MKVLVFFFALISFIPKVSAENSCFGSHVDNEEESKPPTPPPIDYPMKSIPVDSPKFNEIFSAVSAKRNREAKHGTRIKIIQSTGDGDFLARLGNSDQIVMVRLPGRQLADGSRLTEKIESTDRLFEYTDDFGAKHTANSYQLVKPDEEFTPEQFRDRLMMGETYSITKLMPESTCQDCNGFGRIPIRDGNRSGDAKKACPSCDGEGKLRIHQQIIIKW